MIRGYRWKGRIAGEDKVYKDKKAKCLILNFRDPKSFCWQENTEPEKDWKVISYRDVLGIELDEEGNIW